MKRLITWFCRLQDERIDRQIAAFKNVSSYTFTDISSEAFRTYEYPAGYTVTYYKPLLLSVSPSGAHRLFTADGMSHYIATGWNSIHWKARRGCPHFVK